MTVKDILVFALGVGVGIGASYKFISDKLTAKHEEIIAKEKESIKKTYSEYYDKNKSKDEGKTEEAKEKKTKKVEDNVVEKYKELVAEYDEVASTVTDSPEVVKDDVYEITDDEYGEIGYEELDLFYYRNGVLTDDNDEIMEDVEIATSIGSTDILDSRKSDGTYCYIRNDELQIDYCVEMVDEDK